MPSCRALAGLGLPPLADLLEASSIVVVPRRAFAAVRDETDDRVLEAAVEGAANYIVSGDDDLLSLGSFQDILIVPPGEFVGKIQL